MVANGPSHAGRFPLLVLALFLAAAPAPAAAGIGLRALDIDLVVAPPHNEPVLPVSLARYGLRVFHQVDWWRLEWEGDNVAWGTHAREGHPDCSFPDSWRNDTWNLDAIPLSITNRLLFRITDRVHLFAENHAVRYVWGDFVPYNRMVHNLFGFRIRIR